jgi:hypothetical protein
MENTKTIFCSSEKSGVNFEMECYLNAQNEIYIGISNPEDQLEFAFIALNKQTAIKFSKHLRKEISFLLNEEVDNGKA